MLKFSRQEEGSYRVAIDWIKQDVSVIFVKVQQFSLAAHSVRAFSCMHALCTPVFGKMSPRRIISEVLAHIQQSGMLPNAKSVFHWMWHS
ncbi:hypothetical protein Q7C36_015783 [Tachysurus vachellii]|uniref:Uncharacterized protein n=1 Tax=Tachysurus vachellii TaxID=175792 RepID=A0AA88SA75_TACVA|nr:hypothetical protein Q7C36_015783 [Tachysurus vachellii]